MGASHCFGFDFKITQLSLNYFARLIESTHFKLFNLFLYHLCGRDQMRQKVTDFQSI